MNHNRKFFSLSVLVLSLCTALTACGSDFEEGAALDQATTDQVDASTEALTVGNAPMATLTYSQSAADIVNPERGYYVGYNLLSPASAAAVRTSGHSLAIAIVRLDTYRDKALDSAFLTQLNTGFAAARANGIKVVLRFAYNASFATDASKTRILGHIAQLAPVLKANADVIAVMQAGFIGAWGEWHTSTNGLDNNTDRAAILNALLAALPANRSVQVRTPMFKGNIYGSTAVASTEAFSGSARARIGHHNDCFLASSSDMGTYAAPITTWKSYTAADTTFVPMGGETCAVSTQSACAPALADMTSNHWSYLNQAYLGAVINGWQTAGCGTEIKNRLGYRFAMQRVAHNSSVRPGGVLDVEIAIKNYGFAAPFNARPVYVVLTGGGKRQVAQLTAADVRRFAPATVTTLTTKLRIPAGTVAGTYSLSLWMPDAAASLQNDPRYAIRLANDNAWDAVTGENILSKNVVVSASAPGPVSTSTTFAVVP